MIPEWNVQYPSLSEATKEQLDFYKIFSKSIVDDNPVDIEGNLSYIFVYLHNEIITCFSKKEPPVDNLIECLMKFSKFYSHEKILNEYLNYWLTDAYLFKGEYDKAWSHTEKVKLTIDRVINIRSRCTTSTINSKHLLNVLGSKSGLTKFGKENISHVEILVTRFLDEFHFKNGSNIFNFFCKKFDFGNLKEEDFVFLKKLYPNEANFYLHKKIYDERNQIDYDFWRKIITNESEFNALMKTAEESKKEYSFMYKNYLFIGVPSNELLPFVEFTNIPGIIEGALDNELKRIIRESENTVREEKNLPKVGEGWISETNLFYKICTAFPNEYIISHGRPVWLNKQHLDIYFPDKNIAIEYQGIQHQKPIEYFGGLESFEKQQKRDKKKAELCKTNYCFLIYAYEHYDLEKIVNQIKTAIKDR